MKAGTGKYLQDMARMFKVMVVVVMLMVVVVSPPLPRWANVCRS